MVFESMRWLQCFILITHAKRGSGFSNRFGGRENIEAIEFLKQLNQICYEEAPGIMTIAEESTAFPGVSRPVDTGGLWFRLQVEHGLDE